MKNFDKVEDAVEDLKNGKIIGNITYSSEEDILNKLESLGIE